MLIYSTCTFSREENDDNIAWLEAALDAELQLPELPFDGILRTERGFLLLPGSVPGEGQYVSAVRKRSGPPASRKPASALQALHPLRTGVTEGAWRGRDFVPDPDWALSLSCVRGRWPEREVDRRTALRFLHQNGVIIIPKSTHKERMAQNLDILDFALSDNEMNEIRKLDTGKSLFFDHHDGEVAKLFMGWR